MSESLSAFFPITIEEGTEIKSAIDAFLQAVAASIIDALDGRYPEGEIDFAEAPLDEHLDSYLNNPECEKTKRRMIVSLKDYLSDYLRTSEHSDRQIEIYVESEDMEYGAFEFILQEALQYQDFNLKEVTVYGQTKSDHSSRANIWEDKYLSTAGKPNITQANHID